MKIQVPKRYDSAFFKIHVYYYYFLLFILMPTIQKGVFTVIL